MYFNSSCRNKMATKIETFIQNMQILKIQDGGGRQFKMAKILLIYARIQQFKCHFSYNYML